MEWNSWLPSTVKNIKSELFETILRYGHQLSEAASITCSAHKFIRPASVDIALRSTLPVMAVTAIFLFTISIFVLATVTASF